MLSPLGARLPALLLVVRYTPQSQLRLHCLARGCSCWVACSAGVRLQPRPRLQKSSSFQLSGSAKGTRLDSKGPLEPGVGSSLRLGFAEHRFVPMSAGVRLRVLQVDKFYPPHIG